MKNVFVFPCGSEIALEIARSLSGVSHFHLIGGASTPDHGRFVFDDIVEDVPWIDSEAFIPFMVSLIKSRHIDLVYPATDLATVILKRAEKRFGIPVITSPLETAEICLSKRKTYESLQGIVKTPKVFESSDGAIAYPVFGKPDVGHSSKGAMLIRSREEKERFLGNDNTKLLLEYLPGEEYTVDCFTDRYGNLLFSGARVRNRTMNGISVGTEPVTGKDANVFISLVRQINNAIKFRGAWFAQFKRDKVGVPTLMEVAARFGGSSGLHRGLGVNFALLSLWDALDYDVSVCPNRFHITMDRALDNKYKLDIAYDEVFLDYDDTVIMSIDGSYNHKIMALIFACINRSVKITLLSRHRGNLIAELETKGIRQLFTRVFHIGETEDKASYIDNLKSIFIDDSYAERMNIHKRLGVPVFGLDMVDALI